MYLFIHLSEIINFINVRVSEVKKHKKNLFSKQNAHNYIFSERKLIALSFKLQLQKMIFLVLIKILTIKSNFVFFFVVAHVQGQGQCQILSFFFFYLETKSIVCLFFLPFRKCILICQSKICNIFVILVLSKTNP